MCAASTRALSKARTSLGKSPQPSAQAVVLLSTAIGRHSCGDLPVNENTVKTLAAFTAALLGNVLSEDVIHLSMLSAKHMAKESGVPEAEYNRVMASLFLFWRRKKAHNPIASMF
jgi:hypothetical protein